MTDPERLTFCSRNFTPPFQASISPRDVRSQTKLQIEQSASNARPKLIRQRHSDRRIIVPLFELILKNFLSEGKQDPQSAEDCRLKVSIEGSKVATLHETENEDWNQDTLSLEEGLPTSLKEDINTLNGILKIKSQRICELEAQLASTNRFRNMVIHDLRGPTTSIKSGLVFVSTQLKEIKEIYERRQKFSQKCSAVDQHLRSLSNLNPSKLSMNRHLTPQEEVKFQPKQSIANSSSFPYQAPRSVDKASSSCLSNHISESNVSESHEDPIESVRRIKHTLGQIKGDIITQKENLARQIQVIVARSSSLMDHQESLYASQRILEIKNEDPFKLIESRHASIRPPTSPLPMLSPCYRSPEQSRRPSEDQIDEDAEWDVQEGELSERVHQLSKGKNSLLKEKLDRTIADVVALLKTRGFLYDPEETYTFRDQEVLSQKQEIVNALHRILDPAAVRFKNVETQTAADEQPSVEDYKARLGEISHRAADLKSSFLTKETALKEHIGAMEERVEKLRQRLVDSESSQVILKKKMDTFEKYHEDIMKNIFTHTVHSERLIQKQVFSLSMTENLINDLLDLAKLDNSALKFDQEYFDLATLIFQTLDMVAITSKELKIKLEAAIDKQENLEYISAIFGDRRRYVQILLNFLTNALKFTNKGGKVGIYVQILDNQTVKKPESIHISSPNLVEERYISLQIKIVDTGIGIKPEDQEKLFVDFNKLEASNDRNKSGTGLGLSICKMIIEQMGGSVTLHSEVGKGTEFVVSVPTKCQFKPLQVDLSSYKSVSSHGDIIVVDRFDTSYHSRRESPRRQDFVFAFRELAMDALSSPIIDRIQRNIAEQFQSNEMFNIISVPSSLYKQQFYNNQIDQLLSKSSQSASRIKSSSNLFSQGSNTIDSGIYDNRRARRSSYHQSLENKDSLIDDDKQVSQPSPKLKVIKEKDEGTMNKRIINISQTSSYSSSSINVEEEKDSVVGVVGQQSHMSTERSMVKKKSSLFRMSLIFEDQVPEAPEEEESKDSPFRCLLANDEALQLSFLKVILEQNMIDVVAVPNGFEAFQEVQKSLGSLDQTFDLIILDLNMPISNGFEACKKITNLYAQDQAIAYSKGEKNPRAAVKISEIEPMMVACTGHLSQDEELRARNCGFSKAFEAPLNTSTVEREILPFLEARKNRITNILELQNCNEDEVLERVHQSLDLLPPIQLSSRNRRYSENENKEKNSSGSRKSRVSARSKVSREQPLLKSSINSQHFSLGSNSLSDVSPYFELKFGNSGEDVMEEDEAEDFSNAMSEALAGHRVRGAKQRRDFQHSELGESDEDYQSDSL